jgi:serine/threonine protein kinase
VYDAGQADGHLYVATGYIDGTSLASLLAREGRLEPERALAIVTELAEALDAARWGRGLVHGCLKPSEVLVAPAVEAGSVERVFLRGFGLRRELPPRATLADTAGRAGTIGYLAPEQIEGRPVSPRSDVYALGCVLFTPPSGSITTRSSRPPEAVRPLPTCNKPVAGLKRPECNLRGERSRSCTAKGGAGCRLASGWRSNPGASLEREA